MNRQPLEDIYTSIPMDDLRARDFPPRHLQSPEQAALYDRWLAKEDRKDGIVSRTPHVGSNRAQRRKMRKLVRGKGMKVTVT